MSEETDIIHDVSVAGCLGYDVLVAQSKTHQIIEVFQLLVV